MVEIIIAKIEAMISTILIIMINLQAILIVVELETIKDNLITLQVIYESFILFCFFWKDESFIPIYVGITFLIIPFSKKKILKNT